MILKLEGAGVGAAGVAGMFDIVIATGDGVLLWQKRTRRKVRPFVKYTRVLLPYYNKPFFNTTWTGDTHEETDILPSSERDEDG